MSGASKDSLSAMSLARNAVSGILFVTAFHFGICNAAEQAAPEAPKPIFYKDLGPQYEIHGEFGKLYTDFTLRGVVKAPLRKGDTAGMVPIDITHLRGAPLDEKKVNVILHTGSKWVPGSEVELVVREEARLWFPEGIDDVGSAPDASHLGRLSCIVSLHERRLIRLAPPAK